MLNLDRPGIPDFRTLSDRLTALTGWQVVAVPGLVPDDVFFDHMANRRFVAMYLENTALMALFEQATTFDPEVRALRQAARERNVGRVRHSIEQLQRDGLVAADLDAEYSAHALVAMVNGLVHYWLVLGAEFDEERLVQAMTDVWARALGLPTGE